MTRSSTTKAPRAARGRSSRRRGAGGTLIGIFIGIVIGIGLATAVAYWLMRNNPALQVGGSGKDSREASVKEPSRPGKSDAQPDKPRFDFYKNLPDKSVRYRVRLGPYDNTDELNRMKNELGKRGFEVAVIKNQ